MGREIWFEGMKLYRAIITTVTGRMTRSEKAPSLRQRLLLLFLLASSCVTEHAGTPALIRYEYQRPEMGVPFRIALYARDQAAADFAADAAFQRVKQLNDIMSD